MAPTPNLAHQVPPPPDPDGDFRKFLPRFQRLQKYKDIVQVSKPKDVQRLETVSRMCWDLCYADRERLQKRMDELNLNFFKELAGLKVQLASSQGKTAAAPAVDLPDIIEFYEPISYFSDDVREIVLAIIEDRIREILTGMKEDDGIDWEAKCAELEKRVESAEQRAIQARLESQAELRLAQEREAAAQEREAEAKAAMEEALAQIGPLKEEIETLAAKISALEVVIEQQKEEIEQAQAAAQAAMERVQELEAENEKLMEEIAQLRDKITELEKEIEEKKEEIEKLEREVKVLTRRIAELEAELAELLEKMAKAQEEIDRLAKEIERLQAEVEKCLKLIAELQEAAKQYELKIKALESEIKALEKKIVELEDAVARERERAEKAEAKAAELQAELDRRNNTKNKICQTTLTGDQIDEWPKEIDKLKAQIKEWEEKYTELVARLEEQGLAEQVEEISKQLGIHKFYKVRGIFERLHEDSFRKAERMDKLREDFLERSRHHDENRFATESSKLEAEAAIEFDRQINERSTSDLSLASTQSPRKRQAMRDSLPSLHSGPSTRDTQTTWRLVDAMASPSLSRSVPVPHPSAALDATLHGLVPPSGMDVPWMLQPSWQQKPGSARLSGGKNFGATVSGDGFGNMAMTARTRSSSFSHSDAKATQVKLPKLH